jgi:hypothetical protein
MKAGLAGDGRRGARVVARDHDRADAHAAELVEALDEPVLDRVLELDEAQDLAVAAHGQGCGAPVRDAVGLP